MVVIPTLLVATKKNPPTPQKLPLLLEITGKMHTLTILTMADPNQFIFALTTATLAVANVQTAMGKSPSYIAQCCITRAASTSLSPAEKPSAPALPQALVKETIPI